MKKCSVCDEIKDFNEFCNKSSSSDGKANFCKTCKSKKDKIYRENNKEKIKEATKSWHTKNIERSNDYYLNWRLKNKENKKLYDQKYRTENKERKKEYHNSEIAKDSKLKRTYGISLNEYESMLDEQNGVCYICFEKDSVKLAVDHNHKTGEVRKLLCKKCNTAIGLLREDTKIIENVLNYIKLFS